MFIILKENQVRSGLNAVNRNCLINDRISGMIIILSKKKLINENVLITLHCQVFELLKTSIHYETDLIIWHFLIFIRQLGNAIWPQYLFRTYTDYFVIICSLTYLKTNINRIKIK
jgi:hypothetical protein